MFDELKIQSPEIKQSVLVSGDYSASPPLLLLHGNATDSRMWLPFAQLIANKIPLIIPDLRGFGNSSAPVPAENGVQVWVDDLLELLKALGVNRFFLAGHSLGGMIATALLARVPERINGIVLISPGPPFGYGGTKDIFGAPCFYDFAGSGAGLVNPALVKRIKAKDRSTEQPGSSPAAIISRLFFSPGFTPDTTMVKSLLDAMFAMRTGDDGYPGNVEKSPNWPGFKPGKSGIVNALSPKYNTQLFSSVTAIPPELRPPLIWVHGDDDMLVGNRSASDAGTQGLSGLIENWPGSRVFPPQPMYNQLEYFFAEYKNHHKKTKLCRKILLADTGHCPQVEKPGKLAKMMMDFTGMCGDSF